jgi:hypothetical protein
LDEAFRFVVLALTEMVVVDASGGIDKVQGGQYWFENASQMA